MEKTAIDQRHSVRRYLPKELEDRHHFELLKFIDSLNRESGLNFKLVVRDKRAFGTRLARYGKFEDVSNYIVIKGKRGKDFAKRCGYYGEKAVIFAQSLGLNSCWVGLHYKKNKKTFEILSGEKLCCVIAIGYGRNSGAKRRCKTVEQVSNYTQGMPKWFLSGVESALKAPTAINRQAFYFELINENEVKLKTKWGPFYNTDFGIVKYHFEVGAGKENFTWKG